jgi:RNA recognition motif-containing protein
LRNLFEAHGAVEKITLVTDRILTAPVGFSFVEMTNAREADKAIAAINSTDLGPKSERPGGDGRRFGGGGGRVRDDCCGHPRQPREPRW